MQRDPKDVAKQLSTYADAVTAFSVAQSLVFAYAVVGNEFVRQMLRVPDFIVLLIILASYGTYCTIAILCYREENLLVEASEPSRADISTKHISWARIAVIVLAAAITFIAYGFTLRGASERLHHPLSSTPLRLI